ncbi:MAG: hypothetical protein IJ005_05380 [Bacteroidales bacterium]|nr:hypothetical protein [Bacteroidales bacterium]
MKKAFRYIAISICGAIMAAVMITAFVSGTQARRSIVCSRVEIVIADSTRNHFVSKEDVQGYLKAGYGDCIGTAADSIDIRRIEEIVDRQSAVLKSQAYMTNDGTLNISVTQRQPVVRFQKKDGGFYADAEGYIFPLQRSFASHVQIVDGEIPLAADSGYKGSIEAPEEKAWFESIMKVVNHMETDKDWKGKIVQISVGNDGDLTLVPRDGNEKFLFGQPSDIAEKFRKMEKYYTHIIPARGNGYYTSVDLRFRGQIVCRQDNRQRINRYE